MIEVFKTNISCEKEALALLSRLEQQFPGSRVNVDLHDCDRILRIEGEGYSVETIIEVAKESGLFCEELPD